MSTPTGDLQQPIKDDPKVSVSNTTWMTLWIKSQKSHHLRYIHIWLSVEVSVGDLHIDFAGLGTGESVSVRGSVHEAREKIMNLMKENIMPFRVIA